MPRRYDDDWDDDDRPRRRRVRRDDYDDEDDYYDRPRRSQARSGSVTGVAIYGIVLGSIDLLFGICMFMSVAFAGSVVGAAGAFRVPGFGSSFALALMMAILILLWGALAIVGGIGVLNRGQWGRVISFIVAGLGGAFGVYCLVCAVMAMAAPHRVGIFDPGERAFVFLILFIIAALFISYCVWSLVALVRNGHEFS